MQIITKFARSSPIIKLLVIGLLLATLINIQLNNFDPLPLREIYEMDNDYMYSRDMIERAPIYLMLGIPMNADWVFEKQIYNDFEFEEFELKAFMAANIIQIKDELPRTLCPSNTEINKMNHLLIRVLKGNKEIGYSGLVGNLYFNKNELEQSSKVYFIRCFSEDKIYIISQ